MERLEDLLQKEEITGLKLCAMYRNSGYEQFKMSKFEEYDLYARNKEFLVSENVITFTDTNGKLMALKPDVTLSIVKSSSTIKGLYKVYYNENVYRTAKSSGSFKEIRQTGLECIGKVDENNILEVLLLAAKSLKCISENAIIQVANQDMFTGTVEDLGVSSEYKEKILKCIGEKNLHEMAALCKEAGADGASADKLMKIASLNGEGDEIIAKLKEMKCHDDAIERLSFISDGFKKAGMYDMLRIDFSVINDMTYYNGIVFKGFVNGLSEGILSGGQYDRLLEKMHRADKAVGFAVYLDMLERFDEEKSVKQEEKVWLNVALPKGRIGEKVYRMFEASGMPCPEILDESRKLVFENEELGLRFFWVKPSDVTVYVERGVADIGVAGKDIIQEYEPDIYELLDLNIGKCRMCVAGKKDFKDDRSRKLVVATKFSNIARKYYSGVGRDIDIIHLNGSIEIAPILGLSDVIVDIVETGTTLRENNLEVKTEILPISARLIANKAGYEFKKEKITDVQKKLAGLVK